ncbi:MAG: cytochrome-c oxidase, cbb3-type subunit III [Alphaproteobacteria bacterium]
MPTKIEKDHYTGTETTGHEWDGIKELNTPLPKWWLYVLYATIAWSAVYVVLYPAIPYGSGYTKGTLGYSQRVEHEARMKAARAEQAKFLDRIKASSPAHILLNKELLDFARAGGRTAFADNCAACHGAAGGGRPNFPVLADDDWIWGGKIKNIFTTIKFGVRSGHDDELASEMPAFGADETLKPAQIAAVAGYVLSLSGKAAGAGKSSEGKKLFAENCAACHGEKGKGNAELGAPNLSDAIWLYGGTRKAIAAQVDKPRHGTMPSWSSRLDLNTIKMLAVYVHSLGGGK